MNGKGIAYDGGDSAGFALARIGIELHDVCGMNNREKISVMDSRMSVRFRSGDSRNSKMNEIPVHHPLEVA